ncbi:glutathione-dependent formaldehyde-activating [Xylariaceae sp. FL1272]|nr:glutathione-dependent formaldehyde-activating [Xylariaceae sp. FL1272]
MDARCQCGAVQFQTPQPKPLALYICHCDECRRQTGSAFGTSAIFTKFALPDNALLSCYKRLTASGHTLECYFCTQCGTRLIHSTKGKDFVSVKGGCLEGLDWGKAIHIWTKSAMVPIPEGSERHPEEPSDTETCSSQETLDQPPGRNSRHRPLHNSGAPFVDAVSTPEVKELNRVRGACELSGVI